MIVTLTLKGVKNEGSNHSSDMLLNGIIYLYRPIHKRRRTPYRSNNVGDNVCFYSNSIYYSNRGNNLKHNKQNGDWLISKEEMEEVIYYMGLGLTYMRENPNTASIVEMDKLEDFLVKAIEMMKGGETDEKKTKSE